MSKDTMPADRIASAPTVLREISGPQACSMCDAPGLKTELVRNPFICGVGAEAVELVVDFPVHSCASCGRSYRGSDAGSIEHEAVCRHLGLLTPDEIRAIRRQFGMSRAEFAEVTGLGEATIARWERGAVTQNRANDRFLRIVRRTEGRRLLDAVVAEARGTAQLPVSRTARPASLTPELERQIRRTSGPAGWSPRRHRRIG